MHYGIDLSWKTQQDFLKECISYTSIHFFNK